MSRVLPRRSAAALGLCVLLGGLALPLFGLVAGDGPVPSCCRGRCCCTGEATDDGDARTCLRPACGCGRSAAVVMAAPLRVEAVLPAPGAPVVVPPSGTCRTAARERPRWRPDPPPVPPPRRRLRA